MPSQAVKSRKASKRNKGRRGKPNSGAGAGDTNSIVKRSRELGIASRLNEAEAKYLNLIFDPCNADLVSSVLPGPNGSFTSRIPFRVIYITQRSYGMAQLLPWAMDSTTDPKMLTIYEANLSTTSFINGTQSDANIFSIDNTIVGTIGGAADIIRPVAGCIRATYIDVAANARGYLWGAEGNLNSYMNQMTVAPLTHVWLPKNNMNVIELSGTGPFPIQSGVESRLNMVNGDFQYRAMSAGNNVVAAAVDSRSGITNRWPVAYVGWSGITANQWMLIDGVMVYEWVPQASYGMTAPSEVNKNIRPGAFERVVNAVGQLSHSLVTKFSSELSHQGGWMKSLQAGTEWAAGYALQSAMKAAPLLLTV